MCYRKSGGKGPPRHLKERKNKMPKIRIVKVKAGQKELREKILNALAQKGTRARTLIKKLSADDGIVWRYAELDSIALQLRYLAFQIRALKLAKKATEEA